MLSLRELKQHYLNFYAYNKKNIHLLLKLDYKDALLQNYAKQGRENHDNCIIPILSYEATLSGLLDPGEKGITFARNVDI